MALERRDIKLVDENGNPLGDRLDDVLASLASRFLHEFPALCDETTVMDALEEVGRKIARRERQHGPIENVYGYAWVALRSVGVSLSRLKSKRVAIETLPSDESVSALESIATLRGTAEQVEYRILLAEALAHLTEEERLVLARKAAGYTSQEIADHRGTSAGAIDVLFSRTRQKMRRLLGESGGHTATSTDPADPMGADAAARPTVKPPGRHRR